MQKPLTNYAFIDQSNLYYSIKNQGWKLDYKKFRVYLREKYGVQVAYIFMGFVEGYQSLYQSLQKAEFVLVHKETLKYENGKRKGNTDAEMVLQAMIDFNEYDKAVIVSGDGDFACLIRYLNKKDKLEMVLVPGLKKYSSLIPKAAEGKITAIEGSRKKLDYIKRAQ